MREANIVPKEATRHFVVTTNSKSNEWPYQLALTELLAEAANNMISNQALMILSVRTQ